MENKTANNNEINENNENNEKIEVEEKTNSDGYTKNILTGIGAVIALGVGGKIIYDKSKEDKEDDKESDKEDDKESDKEDDKESDEEKDNKDNKEEDSTLKYQGIDDKDSFILELKKKLSLKPRVISDEIDKNNYFWANSQITKEEDDEKKRVESFICPINKKIMEDPVITPYGTTYEKSAILNWIKKNKTDYINNKVLTEDMLVPDYVLKSAIKEYNKSINYNKF